MGILLHIIKLSISALLGLLITAYSVSLYADENTYEDEHVYSGFVVVMNKTDNIPTFTKQQIRHIFMGGRLSRKYKAINWPQNNPLRVKFNTKMIGLTESRIQSYWAQMKFTGGNKPPIEAATLEGIVTLLEETQGAVGYLPVGTKIPDQLAVIFP